MPPNPKSAWQWNRDVLSTDESKAVYDSISTQPSATSIYPLVTHAGNAAITTAASQFNPSDLATSYQETADSFVDKMVADGERRMPDGLPALHFLSGNYVWL